MQQRTIQQLLVVTPIAEPNGPQNIHTKDRAQYNTNQWMINLPILHKFGPKSLKGSFFRCVHEVVFRHLSSLCTPLHENR